MKYDIYDNYIGHPRKQLAAALDVDIAHTETRGVFEFRVDEESPLAKIFAKDKCLEFVDSLGRSSTYSFLNSTPDFKRGRDAISGIRVRKEH